MGTLLSVLTPSKDYGHFIGDSIRSVLEQPLDVEHVIQDALSNDDTAKVARSFDDRVSLRSETDAGQSDALNKAFSRSRGEWIGWLNADEFYLPGGPSRLIAHAEETGADLVYGDAIFVDADGRFLRAVPQHGFSRRVLRGYGTYISSCATVIRRRALGDSPWDERLRLVMDRDVFLTIAAAGGKIEHLPHPVGAFRVHGDRVSAGSRDVFESDYATIFERHGRVGSTGRTAARLLHAGLKLTSGAYSRQRRAGALRGKDMRWFDGPDGLRNCDELLARAYGDARARS